MRQFLTVLKFELGNYFKNKSFLLTTIVLMVLAVGIIAVPGMLFGQGTKTENSAGQAVETRKEQPEEDAPEDMEEQERYALYDMNGSIQDPSVLATYMGRNITWLKCGSERELEEMVSSGKAEAGFAVEDLLHYTYVVEDRSAYDTVQETFSEAAAATYRSQVLEEKGLDPAWRSRRSISTQPESETRVLGKDSAGSYAYTYMLIMVLYFLLIFYGQMIATSVTSEKSNRAIEILVTSVDSSSLIFGKVLAGAIAGLIQCAPAPGKRRGGLSDLPGELGRSAGQCI